MRFENRKPYLEIQNPRMKMQVISSQRLRADKDIALAAVKQNKKSFSYIADELKNDEDIQNIINPPQEG